jgi:hypothetical protein
MSIDRFYRKPMTSDEWRSRARTIQSRLEGLSVDELMRGATKHGGEPIGRGSHEYDPHQPRVPAGHPDGGQWTHQGTNGSARIEDVRGDPDEALEDYWTPGADVAARGHHFMPREFYRRLPFTRETRKVFRDARQEHCRTESIPKTGLRFSAIGLTTHIDNTMLPCIN